MLSAANRSATAGFDPGAVSGQGRARATRAYTLGSDAAEQARLRRQSAELRDHAAALLDRVALGQGQRAIDLACGPSGMLELLSDRVGARGQVIGLDCDPTHVALAHGLALERGLTNVTVLEGDARRTQLPQGSFDLVHARLLLINIPRPAEVLTEMVRLAKPGGWVDSQEADALLLCQPPHPAWERLSEVLRETYRQDGADLQIGRRLPELYRAAGLVDVGVAVHADHHAAGDTRHTLIPDLVRTMRAKISQRELVSEQELEALDDTIRTHLNDHGTITVPHLLFSVWGRKPR